MIATLIAFLAGLLFGIGLLVSGMANPAKVIGFLDLSAHWDPSLAFVMAGAIAVALPASLLASRRSSTFLGMPLHLPAANDIDARLVLGSVAFGIGWGMAGFCPGPALVALGMGHPKAIIFVVAMLAGMLVFEMLEHGRAGLASEP